MDISWVQLGHDWLIAGATVLLGLVAWAMVLRTLKRLERRRRVHLKEQETVLPVDTYAPESSPEERLRRRGYRSIRAHFTVTRKALMPVAVVLIGGLASIPFLDRAPGVVLSAGMAILSVFLGIATRPYLENLIAGLVISFSRVVHIGDTIMLGESYGTIEDITTTHTTIKLWDWRRQVVPNSRMLQQEFTNYSLFDEHVWAHVAFHVDPAADLALVEKLAVEAAKQASTFKPYEEPTFWVLECHRDALVCWIAAWTDSAADAWALRSDTAKALMHSLRAHGIATHSFNVAHLGNLSNPSGASGSSSSSSSSSAPSAERPG